MKIYSIKDLANEKYILTDISAIHRVPAYRYLKINSRILNGFLLIDEGTCLYEWDTCVVTLNKGDIIYLPQTSMHVLKVITKEFSFYRVDFTITSVDGENIIFASHPEIMYKNCDENTLNKIIDLTELFHDANSFYRSAAILYELFDLFSKNTHSPKKSSISQAIEYIERNYTQSVDCSSLAKMCLMSNAKMYRIFKAELGYTPVEYKNLLRINRAKLILERDICSVTEIAFLLGYESVYYFSRAFKKYAGVSPREYRLSFSKGNNEVSDC